MTEKPPRYARVIHGHPALSLPNAATRGTWITMFALADATWPASAPVPRSCAAKAVRELVAEGLIVLEGLDGFRCPDLDALRQGISDKAARSVAHRYDRDTTVEPPNIDRTTGDLLRDETQRNETQRDTTQRNGDTTSAPAPDEAREVWGVIGRLTGSDARSPGYDDQIKDLVRRHGQAKVVAALHRAAGAVPDRPAIRQLVFGASDDLDRIPQVAPESEHDRTLRQVRAKIATQAAST